MAIKFTDKEKELLKERDFFEHDFQARINYRYKQELLDELIEMVELYGISWRRWDTYFFIKAKNLRERYYWYFRVDEKKYQWVTDLNNFNDVWEDVIRKILWIEVVEKVVKKKRGRPRKKIEDFPRQEAVVLHWDDIEWLNRRLGVDGIGVANAIPVDDGEKINVVDF